MLCLLTLFLCFSATIDRTHFARASVRAGAFIHLRIEGLDSTILEGPLFTKSHNVTTPSGGTHECDGLNNNSNPKAGPAASTTTLDDAARLAGFLLDGTFSSELRLLHRERRPRHRNFDTVSGTITRISADACRGLMHSENNALWTLDAFNENAFLKLEGPKTVHKGQNAVLTVTDGSTDEPVVDAMVGGQVTDTDGDATIHFPAAGARIFKATKDMTIRSNSIERWAQYWSETGAVGSRC